MHESGPAAGSMDCMADGHDIPDTKEEPLSTVAQARILQIRYTMYRSLLKSIACGDHRSARYRVGPATASAILKDKHQNHQKHTEGMVMV